MRLFFKITGALRKDICAGKPVFFHLLFFIERL